MLMNVPWEEEAVSSDARILTEVSNADVQTTTTGWAPGKSSIIGYLHSLKIV